MLPKGKGDGFFIRYTVPVIRFQTDIFIFLRLATLKRPLLLPFGRGDLNIRTD